MQVATAIIVATIVVALALGLLARRSKQMTFEQWTVAGRQFGSLLVFLLQAGEIYTTFTFLGASGWAYGIGGPTAYILAYGALAYVLSYFLLPPIWRYAKQHDLVSQPDFFERKFRSKWLGVLVALVGVVAIVPYLQLQLTGLGLIVETTSHGVISQVAAIAIATVVLAVYVTASGIHGTAWTSVLKDVWILIVVLFLGIAVPAHLGGLGRMFARIDAARPGFLILGHGGMGVPWFISTVLLTAVGFYMWPHAFGAVYSARSDRILRRNASLLPLYQLILLFVFFVGFGAILIAPGLKDSNGALLAAVEKLFPSWVAGLVGGAGLLAGLVPGSLLLVSGSTLLAENVVRPLVPGLKKRSVEVLALVLVWVLAGVAFLFSIHSNAAIVVLLLMGYNFVSQFFPAVLLAVFARKRVSRFGAGAGILVGVALVVYFTLSGQSIVWGLNSGFVALVVNAVVVLAVSALSPDGREAEEAPAQA